MLDEPFFHNNVIIIKSKNLRLEIYIKIYETPHKNTCTFIFNLAGDNCKYESSTQTSHVLNENMLIASPNNVGDVHGA